MLLSKNKLALAIIAATAVSGAAQATEVTVGGVVQTRYVMSQTGGDQAVTAGDVRLQISASETKGDLTGYASYRLDADNLSGNNLSGDDIHTGLKGSFGDVRLGQVWKVNHGEFANDIHGYASDAQSHVGYQNTFSGVTFSAAFAPEGSGDETRLGFETSISGVTVGGSILNDGASSNDDTVFGASVSLGAVTLDAHAADKETTNEEITAFRASTNLGAWSAAVTVSEVEDTDTADNNETVTRLDLGTDIMDGVNFSIRHNRTDEDAALSTQTDSNETYMQLAVSF